ncbi:hypothetical protein Ct9H90mP29_20510 [bacterium]|nr:MAG: hypothetical protein Ct9H90mP29_20510 [bacterium]
MVVKASLVWRLCLAGTWFRLYTYYWLAKRLEEVFVPGNSEPQIIHKQSPGLILLKRIRDEAIDLQ